MFSLVCLIGRFSFRCRPLTLYSHVRISPLSAAARSLVCRGIAQSPFGFSPSQRCPPFSFSPSFLFFSITILLCFVCLCFFWLFAPVSSDRRRVFFFPSQSSRFPAVPLHIHLDIPCCVAIPDLVVEPRVTYLFISIGRVVPRLVSSLRCAARTTANGVVSCADYDSDRHRQRERMTLTRE